MLFAFMRLLRRILTTIIVTLAVIALVAFWIAPVWLSFDTARKASPAARVVPTDLKNLSVSQAPGASVSYVGYEFELPWTDLDESQTKFVPNGKPFMAALVFRSGLHLIVSASPARVFPNGFARDWKMSPQSIESIFGRGAMESDYRFHQNMFQFTPEKMHRWAFSPRVHYREMFLLMIKTTVLSGSSADTGIFNIQDQNCHGFQIGDPRAHPRRVQLKCFSDEGNVEFIFGSGDGEGSVAVTQADLNRIARSIRKVPQESRAPQASLR